MAKYKSFRVDGKDRYGLTAKYLALRKKGVEINLQFFSGGEIICVVLAAGPDRP